MADESINVGCLIALGVCAFVWGVVIAAVLWIVL